MFSYDYELALKGYLGNDNAHGYSLLTYYITVSDQIKQLEEAGFLQIEAYDMEGHRVKTGRDFPWTYYLARK